MTGLTRASISRLAGAGLSSTEAAAELMTSWRNLIKCATAWGIVFPDMPPLANTSDSSADSAAAETSVPSDKSRGTVRRDNKTKRMLAPRKPRPGRSAGTGSSHCLVPEILRPQPSAGTDMLSEEEEHALIKTWQDLRETDLPTALKARNRVLEKYKPLLKRHTNYYTYARKMFSIRDDIDQAARLALIATLDTFDTERGTRLGSYAQYHIANAIQIVVRGHLRQIKFSGGKPERLARQAWLHFAETRDLQSATHKDCERIAEQTNLSPDRVERVLQFCINRDLYIENANSETFMRSLANDWRIMADRSALPAAMMQKTQEHEFAHKILRAVADDIGPVEALILNTRLMNPGKKVALDRLAERLGSTAFKVQSIEKRLIKKMRKAAVGLGITPKCLTDDPEISVFSELMT